MRTLVALLLLGTVAYSSIIVPFTRYLNGRPFAAQLGFIPKKEILCGLSADHRELAAAMTIIKVILYFGELLEKRVDRIMVTTDYTEMSRQIRVAGYLDPYNADLYYFTQAAFAIGVNGTTFVNEMLVNGMKYRTWDEQLPFFAGFNAAFTLKDYRSAAEFMKRAGEISGEPLYASLAARFFNEAGETDFGILFMESMEKNAKDDKIRRLYADKKRLLIQVKTIKVALATYQDRFERKPSRLEDLVEAGILARIPDDPFGGAFYLDQQGEVATTSGNLRIRTN